MSKSQINFFRPTNLKRGQISESWPKKGQPVNLGHIADIRYASALWLSSTADCICFTVMIHAEFTGNSSWSANTCVVASNCSFSSCGCSLLLCHVPVADEKSEPSACGSQRKYGRRTGIYAKSQRWGTQLLVARQHQHILHSVHFVQSRFNVMVRKFPVGFWIK